MVPESVSGALAFRAGVEDVVKRDSPPVSQAVMKLVVLKAKMAQHLASLRHEENSRTERKLGNGLKERSRVDSGVRPH